MTVFNTVGKIGRRFASELNNLIAKVLEQSSISNTINLGIQTVDKEFNTVDKIKRRKVSELQGLKMSVLESSKRNNTVKSLGFKFIKPIKNYKNKIKMLFKHSNKIKY